MKDVHIPLRDGRHIEAFLVVPKDAKGLVLFAHGTGSGRNSIRNRLVADVLDGSSIGTLVLDLMTHEEEHADRENAEHHFNIEMLAARLVDATQWVHAQPELTSLHLGYFGGSTGAAAALIAASELHSSIKAVVSRGGNVELAGHHVQRVAAPTLFIVGGDDADVLAQNEKVAASFAPDHELQVIPHAGHLFEEPGALATVARLARDWFAKYLH